MERMAAPLSEVIPILLESHSKAAKVTKIPLGDVAIAMLNCIQAMHDKGNLFVDVKPENFMLSSSNSAAASSKKSMKSSSSNNGDVSQRVRLIDFGLVEMFSDMTSSAHRENAYPGAPLVGTPTYASLNIMDGHTAARRDDVEALGYVVSELILMLVASASGSAGKRKKKDDDEVLPWSHASSDDELKRIKSQEMDKSKRSKSKFFAGLKAAGADTVMGNYFSAVRGLDFAEKPDYDSLRCYLKKLIVTVENSGGSSAAKKKASSASPKKMPARRASARRKQVDDEDSDDSIEVIDENVENRKKASGKGKKQKVSVDKESVPRRSARSKRNAPKTCEIGTQTDEMEVIDVDASADEETTMDWEVVASDDDNDDDESTGSDTVVTGKGILKLDIIEGPHRGQEIAFGGDHPDTVCIGKDPDSCAMKDTTKFALADDDSASDVHAKFVINSKKNVNSVRVTNMSSSDGTVVNGTSLAKGKSKQAFVGDKVKIGKSLFQIRKA